MKNADQIKDSKIELTSTLLIRCLDTMSKLDYPVWERESLQDKLKKLKLEESVHSALIERMSFPIEDFGKAIKILIKGDNPNKVLDRPSIEVEIKIIDISPRINLKKFCHDHAVEKSEPAGKPGSLEWMGRYLYEYFKCLQAEKLTKIKVLLPGDI